MKAAQMNRRLAKLSAKFQPRGIRRFTLEELCRLYWRMDKPGFRAMVVESPMFRFFVGQFEREDAGKHDGASARRLGPAGSGVQNSHR